MKKNMIAVAVATTLGLASLASVAEDMYRGAWYAVPGVSYMDTDSNLDANNGGGAFIKLGKELSTGWDIQGGLGYNRASEDTNITGVGGRYKQTTLGLDALYMFSREKFRPFVLAGLGIARNDVDYTNFAALQGRSNTSWMANVGLGAQYLFTDNFGLQADLRHQWSRADANAPGTNFDADETIVRFKNGGGVFSILRSFLVFFILLKGNHGSINLVLPPHLLLDLCDQQAISYELASVVVFVVVVP